MLGARMRALLDLETSALSTRAELESLLSNLALFQFVGEAELPGRPELLPGPLERALQVIDERLGSPRLIHELTIAAAGSTSHLMRLSHRHLGTTPGSYLWQRRVERGIQLLEETGLPIGEVARRCGFATSHHFSRKVREAAGVSPAIVRRRAWATARR